MLLVNALSPLITFTVRSLYAAVLPDVQKGTATKWDPVRFG